MGIACAPDRVRAAGVRQLPLACRRRRRTARRAALVDDFAIPSRDELIVALADLAGRWDSGPFGEPARLLLARHATSVQRVLEHYDRLVAAANGRPERMVLTHGEPHRGNTITTDDGFVLIDWDTALIAPPERDLWAFADEDRQVLDDYTARTGVTPERRSGRALPAEVGSDGDLDLHRRLPTAPPRDGRHLRSLGRHQPISRPRPMASRALTQADARRDHTRSRR